MVFIEIIYEFQGEYLVLIGDMGFNNYNISSSMNGVNNNSVSHAFEEITERNSINNIAERRSSSDLKMLVHTIISRG